MGGALTLTHMIANLCPLLPHVAVGIRNPRKATRGHFLQWFFCTHQTHTSMLLWWAALSYPLNGRPRLGGISNLIQSTAQRFETMGSGLFSFTRNHHAF